MKARWMMAPLHAKDLNNKKGGTKKRQAFRVLKLALLVIWATFLLTGCVTDAEIEAARAQGGASATPAPNTTPGAPLESGVSGELGETGTIDDLNKEDMSADADKKPQGIIDQLVSLLGSRNQSLQIIALLTILSIAPSLLIMLTSFLRIVMVLSFTRNAMGLQQMPPNQALVGLALFLSFFVMGPVFDQIKTEAYIPYAAEQISLDEAIDRGSVPIKRFMLSQTRGGDLDMFYTFADLEAPTTEQEELDTPMRIAIPAFLTSELRRAFEIGFFIYIPFIVIDMIVASTLMAMGMMMLPPIVISLPFKVLLFVLVDGWQLTVYTLINSFY